MKLIIEHMEFRNMRTLIIIIAILMVNCSLVNAKINFVIASYYEKLLVLQEGPQAYSTAKILKNILEKSDWNDFYDTFVEPVINKMDVDEYVYIDDEQNLYGISEWKPIAKDDYKEYKKKKLKNTFSTIVDIINTMKEGNDTLIIPYHSFYGVYVKDIIDTLNIKEYPFTIDRNILNKIPNITNYGDPQSMKSRVVLTYPYTENKEIPKNLYIIYHPLMAGQLIKFSYREYKKLYTEKNISTFDEGNTQEQYPPIIDKDLYLEILNGNINEILNEEYNFLFILPFEY